MKYLLDTHTFLWFINGDEQLSKNAKEAITNPDRVKYVSIISFWEIAIKK
jgi:PIN domain nuclease of toxin-antitoxin system